MSTSLLTISDFWSFYTEQLHNVCVRDPLKTAILNVNDQIKLQVTDNTFFKAKLLGTDQVGTIVMQRYLAL